MKRHLQSQIRGYTIAELTIAAGLAVVVSGFIATFLSTTTLLYAKNASTNLTHQSIRSSLDKMVQDVTAANGAIKLITPTGVSVAAGSAAGMRFDVLRGNPFVVLPTSAGAGLPAGTTTLVLQRSTDGMASPAKPELGDVLLIDGATDKRLLVQSSIYGSTSGSVQNISVTLQAPLATAIPWTAAATKVARNVRPVAYVVVPSGSNNELRYFWGCEGVTNLATASTFYRVIVNVGLMAGDETPFSFVPAQGGTFLRTVLRVRSDRYDTRLANKEANKFSAIQRIEFLMTPRNS